MLPDTSRFFEQGMADRQNTLTQYNIGTGRRPTADQEYSFGQGMMSPLLAYDLKRRQMAQERWDRLAQNWQQGHDQRKQQPSDFEKWTKGIVGGAMLAGTALGGTGGLMGALSTAKGMASPIASAAGIGLGGVSDLSQFAGQVSPTQGNDFWNMFG